ncbi:MAG: thioredoxin [Eubacteriales bacterium]|nr:thioredoxin [Eubacteriales bacterium]
MAVVQVTVDTFQQEVLEAEQVVLVDFWADWCGPCKMLGPIVDQIADQHTDVKVCKVNIDQNASLAIDYRVMNIPNLIVFKNGEQVDQLIGVHSKDDIEAVLAAHK